MLTKKEKEQILDVFNRHKKWKHTLMMEELLAEINRLRAESCADLIGQEHRLGSRIDVLEKELNGMRKRNSCETCKKPEEASLIPNGNEIIGQADNG